MYQLNEYKVTELINKFPNTRWPESSINRLLKKLRDTGSTHRPTGSCRPRSAALKKLKRMFDVLSQEDAPQTHRTVVCEISRETDIWLGCYEITAMSLVGVFINWNTV